MPSLINIHTSRIYPVDLVVENGRIVSVDEVSGEATGPYILPGFVDAHIHVESSMLVPSEFARVAVVHGTVATVSDPHEIANVLGLAGVRYMIEDGERVPFTFAFGAPSCVPATPFESAGAVLGPKEVEELLRDDRILYLSEMMNYPGAINRDPDVMAKIAAAQRLGLPVDGHAPGVRGDALQAYIDAGISTDHESFTYEEGKEKLERGMKLLIREGSAARNFDALWPLLNEYPDRCMFSSDDRHPDDLIEGHINLLVKKAVRNGVDLMVALRTASLHPVEHYGLSVGLLRPGDRADYIVIDNLEEMNVLKTVIGGETVAENGESRIPSHPIRIVNNFTPRSVSAEEIAVSYEGESGGSVNVRVIEAIDGQIVTGKTERMLPIEEGKIVADPSQDVAKIVVVNRYEQAPPAAAFITGFGLREGALASSVAHDSHNVVAVGTSDEYILRAIELVMHQNGGLSAVSPTAHEVLPLPVAGLMSDRDPWSVADAYSVIDNFVRNDVGSTLAAPFMTLSFMCLLVIPSLKLGDRGLFDGEGFEFVEVSL